MYVEEVLIDCLVLECWAISSVLMGEEALQSRDEKGD